MHIQQVVPERGTCHLWWARATDANRSLVAVLSAEEQARVRAFRLLSHRCQAVVSFGLLRLLIATYLGGDPAALQLSRTCPVCGGPHGRPRLTISPPIPIQFNVSHSGDRVVVAITVADPVGVDVEQIRHGLSVPDLAAVALTRPERERIHQWPPEDRHRAFLTYWTRKEAVLKATGHGLSLPLQDIAVTGPDEPPKVLYWARDPSFAAKVTLRDLDLGPDHVGCVAVVGPCQQVVIKHAAPLLSAWSTYEGTS